MIEGVILCFSPCERMAHIWCSTNDAPLCLAYRDDFPQLWEALQIGSCVRLSMQENGVLLRATKMELRSFAGADAG